MDRSYIGLLVLLIFIATATQAFPYEEPLCRGISKPCSRNDDCCDGCCFKDKCVSYADSCIRENNPCSVHECPPNTVCYLQKVQCIRAPCFPIPACRPLDYNYD